MKFAGTIMQAIAPVAMSISAYYIKMSTDIKWENYLPTIESVSSTRDCISFTIFISFFLLVVATFLFPPATLKRADP